MKKQILIKLEIVKDLFILNNNLYKQIKCNNTAIIKAFMQLSSINLKYLEYLGEINIIDSILLYIIKANDNFVKSIQHIIYGLNK